MMEMLSRRSRSGDVCINLARQYLLNNEWGMARLAVEEGMARGHLTDPAQARALLDKISTRLGLVPGQGEHGSMKH